MDHSKNTFLVSVGIPVVKSNFLLTTIESCQKQTYKNLEILILNNASTKEKGDEIESIVNGFNDNRIKYYRNEIQLPMIENWNCVLSLICSFSICSIILCIRFIPIKTRSFFKKFI